ncbi:MAG: hypothetical protein FWC81_00275 [Coriobacteriia bacterium]|nr:hypothetical protein [Coriobacteriia bacterium]MCL2605824.1 hypothetical protein [Coriobacteriia bacterium]
MADGQVDRDEIVGKQVVLTQELMNQIAAVAPQTGNLHRVYTLNGIPPRKLGNAVTSYAQTMGSDETVIMLYDDTLWGSARDGFLLTTKRFYGKNIADSNSFVEISDISSVDFQRGGVLSPAEIHVHIKAGVILRKHLTMSAQKNQAENLVQAVKQIVMLLQSGIKDSAPAANVQDESSQQQTAVRCKGCGATVQAGTICKFCRSLA